MEEVKVKEIVKAYAIGTPVFYFDDKMQGELKIKESVIYGSFVHKTDGELFYFLESKESAAYLVSDSEEGIKEKLSKYEEYRTDLMEKTKNQIAKFAEFRKEFLHSDYKQEQTQEGVPNVEK